MANKKVTIYYNGNPILQQELSNSTITYNNNVLSSDFVGTKTLNCANQIMNGNVVVGTRTLICNGQLMNSNVSVNSIGIVGAKPSGATYNYTGGTFSPYNVPEGVISSGITSASAGGNYTAYYTPDSNHCWNDGTTNTVTVNWAIQYVWNRYYSNPYYSYNTESINIPEGVTQQVLTGSTYIASGNRLLDFNTNTGQWRHASVWDRESDYICPSDMDQWFWTTNDTSTGETYFSQYFECEDGGYTSYMYPNGTIVNTLSGFATVVKGTKYYSYVAGYNRGSYIDQVGNTSNVYPSDGRHSDGYWYVKTW